MPKDSAITDFFIVTPSYNQAQFISETIKGVRKQRGKFAVTHWVFDADSTDGTQTILKRQQKDISWQSKKDRGQSHAINKGILELKKFLKNKKKKPEQVVFAYLNSDDFYLRGAFKKVATHFDISPERDWLVGDCLIINESGQEIQRAVRRYKALARKILSKAMFGVANPIPQPATFIRASAVLKVGQFTEALRYTMDYEYWLRLWQFAGRPILVSAPLAAFRIHGQSKGGIGYKNQFGEQLEVAKKFFKNPGILLLQKAHNYLINVVYALIK